MLGFNLLNSTASGCPRRLQAVSGWSSLTATRGEDQKPSMHFAASAESTSARELARRATRVTDNPFPKYEHGVSTRGRSPPESRSTSKNGNLSSASSLSSSSQPSMSSEERITGLSPGPDAPPPVALAPTWTVTPLPLCTVQEVQALMRACEVPEFALRQLKENGIAGSDLLGLTFSELTEEPRFRFPPVVARKVLRVPISWRLLTTLAGSDVVMAVSRQRFLVAVTAAGLIEHSPRTSQYEALDGLARCDALFTSGFDVDGDGSVNLEELSRASVWLAQVLLEELQGSAALGSSVYGSRAAPVEDDGCPIPEGADSAADSNQQQKQKGRGYPFATPVCAPLLRAKLLGICREILALSSGPK